MNCIRPCLVAACAALACAGAAAFDLEGHRGTRGLEPENTLPAFERALAIGVTTLETDVGMTADGVLVLSHDPFLNPTITRDATGRWLAGARGPLIHSLTLAQLQAYDVGRIKPDTPYAKTFATQHGRDGVHIPTLAQLFARVRELGAESVRFNIETKLDPHEPDHTVAPQEMVRALLREIDAAGIRRRVTIQSFDWRSLQLAQQLAPDIPTVYLTIQTANADNTGDPAWTAGLRLADHGSVPKLVKAAGGAIWSPNGGAVTQALVQEAHALGLQVVPWTINSPAEMERLAGWGVDGLITDYPDRLRGVLQARGIELPPPASPR